MLHVNFLKQNNHLEVDVQTFLKRFIMESPFRVPDSVGDGVCLSVDAPYKEENACVNIKRPGYVRNNFGKTDNRIKPSHNGNVYRFTYGTGSGAITHGIAMRYVVLFIPMNTRCIHISYQLSNSQCVARDFPEELNRISNGVYEYISRLYKNDIDVVIEPFNTAVVLLYYDRKKTDNDYVQIQYHRDQRYNTNGDFMHSQNCQLKNSLTCVFNIGDTRNLNVQLFKNAPMEYIRDIKKTTFELNHGSLFVLHPSDEIPKKRCCLQSDYKTFFKHGDVRFGKGDKLSIGFAFRTSIHSKEVCKETGKFILPEEIEPKHAAVYKNREDILLDYFKNRENVQRDENHLRILYGKISSTYFDK